MVDDEGTIVRRGKVANHPADLAKLHDALPEDVEIGLEGPGYCRRAIERAFRDRAVFEISPAWTHEKRVHGPQPDKDDPKDADRAARVLHENRERLVPLGPRSDTRDALQAAVAVYRSVRQELTQVAQRVHWHLTELWHGSYKRLFTDPLCTTARRFFAAYPIPHRAHRARKLAEKLREWSHGAKGKALADAIHAATTGFPEPNAADEIWAEQLIDLLARYEELLKKRADLRARIQMLVEELDCAYLMEIKGIGPVQAAELIVGGLLESPGPDQFARHCGIAPVKSSTGENERHINAKARHNPLFAVMMDLAAWNLNGRCGDPRSRMYYDAKRAEGKTKRTAQRCLARRFIDIILDARNLHRRLRDSQASSQALRRAA